MDFCLASTRALSSFSPPVSQRTISKASFRTMWEDWWWWYYSFIWLSLHRLSWEMELWMHQWPPLMMWRSPIPCHELYLPFLSPRRSFKHMLVGICGEIASKTLLGVSRIWEAVQKRVRKGSAGEDRRSSSRMPSPIHCGVLLHPQLRNLTCVWWHWPAVCACCKEASSNLYELLMVPWRMGRHLWMVNSFHYLKGLYSFVLDQGAISPDLPWELAQEEAVFSGTAMNLVEGSFDTRKSFSSHPHSMQCHQHLLWWVPLLRVGGNCHEAASPAERRGLGYGVERILFGRKERRKKTEWGNQVLLLLWQSVCAQPTDAYASKVSPSPWTGYGLGLHSSHLR